MVGRFCVGPSRMWILLECLFLLIAATCRLVEGFMLTKSMACSGIAPEKAIAKSGSSDSSMSISVGSPPGTMPRAFFGYAQHLAAF